MLEKTLQHSEVSVTTSKSLSIRERIEYGQRTLNAKHGSSTLSVDMGAFLDEFVGRMSSDGTR